MENRVGFRFIPTDEEIVDYYLRLKNLGGDTSHVDKAISTVDICSFEPWELPSKSRRESRDQIWYFFGRKENKYNRGERQSRITKSGFWKKTGVTTNIIRKRGNREKIGEKRVLVFHSNSEWVMHEYVSTFLSPTQTTYTVCKVIFKGDPRDLPSSSSSAPGGGGGEVEHNHSQFTHMNNSGEFEVGLHLFQSGHRECDNDFISILPFIELKNSNIRDTLSY
uniref:NAC domain-containing protein n=1 Tax=Brassica oleracea var. oleracea TaxID=109376 RepID=A0A0D3C719_BRAOL